MRWPIRYQILVPFVGLQLATVGVVGGVMSWLAVVQAKGEIQTRVAEVQQTLEETNFPLSRQILEQLKSLSGGDFVVISDQEIVSSTLTLRSEDQEVLVINHGNELGRSALSFERLMTIQGQRYFSGISRRLQSVPPSSVMILYPETKWHIARWEAVAPPLFAGCCLLVATVLISTWVSGRISGRVQLTHQHVARIAGGDYTPTNVRDGDDELIDLSCAVNQMAGIIAQSLRTAREGERSRLISQLVGGLAHQLRNALTGARISIQLHERRCEKRDDEALGVALRQLRMTEEQIKSLLRLSRGESEPRFREKLKVIVDDVIGLTLPIFAHRQIEFVCRSTSFPGLVDDADAVRSALLNVMLNAMDACGPGGEVGLGCEVTDGNVVLEIIDNGPGICDEISESIFQPFFTTKPEGVGLGLAMARRALEDNAGSITMERRGELTVFRLQFPYQEELSDEVTLETELYHNEVMR